MTSSNTYEHLAQENAELQSRLDEAEETLRAIRAGEVDAFVFSTAQGNQVFTLQSADQPYRVLVEEMQQGAVTVARDGTILYCNRRFADIAGYPAEQIISHKITDYIVVDEREQFAAFLQDAKSEYGTYHEFNCQRPTHEVVPVYVAANVLQLDQVHVICLIMTDLRLRKQAEQQAIDLRLERERTKLLAEFVRNTSHDLKTPITAIVTGLYSLEQMDDAERRSTKIHKVANYAIYLNRVLDQLQQLAILDSISTLPLQYGDINAVITDAVSAVGMKLDEKSIALSTTLESDMRHVPIDAESLTRALVELFENAIRATPPGGSIELRCAYRDDDTLIIEVQDSGSGIEPHSLSRIFERFFKADEARGMTGGGGLGLSMVKRVVELHHGSVEVKTVPGKQTIFRIALPLNDPDGTQINGD